MATNADIQGIGGNAEGKTVEITLRKRGGEAPARVTAAIVPNITRIMKKDENVFRQLINSSVNELKHQPNAQGIHERKFQMCTGGRVDMLLGQNMGQDYFPTEVAILSKDNTKGLKISRHQIELQDETKEFGISGSFPKIFSYMYDKETHPKTLTIQENLQQAQEEIDSVFPQDASVEIPR